MIPTNLDTTITMTKENDRSFGMKRNALFLLIACALFLAILSSCSNLNGGNQQAKSKATVHDLSTNNSNVEITKRIGGGRGGITPRQPANNPYRSGYRSPTVKPAPAPSRRGLFWGFGLGALFGSIFHPFSGFYGFGSSLFGLLFWIVILAVIYKFFRRFFSRTRM
jgi:uncharacterized membrane protein